MKIPPFSFESILDSRGVPTLYVVATVADVKIEAKVPAGTSTGSHEAVALPIEQVIKQQFELQKWLAGSEFTTLEEFDEALLKKDGTDNKQSLGGNTMLGLSMLFARVAAETEHQSLAVWLAREYHRGWSQPPATIPKQSHPVPMMVMIEGGKHAQSGPFMQELLINGSLVDGTKVWHQLDTGDPMGMEGGFDVSFATKDEADRGGLLKIKEAISETATAVTISVDAAANNIPEEYRYSVASYVALAQEFALQSIEDPFLEDDFESWSRLCLELQGHRLSTKVIGDDLTVTNPARLKEALAKKALTGVIIKPNQIGTVTETLQFVRLAKENQLTTIVSHRSGETDDTFIADLAVAVEADSLKAGAPSKPERLVKYERLTSLANG